MNELRKETGKYFLDISKLVFGGAVLASILKIEDIDKIWILIIGTLVTLLFATAGLIFISKSK